ncbi:MAG: S9 family peptidase [Candidatus Electryonea clarkiae]|nr:S9 family peptidase [Candidatus Electryonea clarkiae]MDP8288773.1 S9 family peptidase [Candidatus Electryonea clarkiae]
MRKSHIIIILSLLLASIAFSQAVERTHDIVPEDYFTQAFLSDCEASPDGKYTAYVDYRWDKENDRRSRDLWVLENKTKDILRLTFDPGNETNPQWSPDSKRLYFTGHYKREGATEPPYDGKTQVWRIQVDGKELTPVTRIPDGISGFQLADDESSIYYTRDKEHITGDWKELRSEYKNDLKFGHGINQVSELWKLDLTTWRVEKLSAPERYIGSFVVSPDQKQIAMVTTPDDKLISNEGWSDVRIFDIASGTLTILPDKLWRAEAPSPYGWLGGLAWSTDSKKVAFSVDFDGFPAEILVANLSKGNENAMIQRLPRPDGVSTAGGLRWIPGRDAVAFVGEMKARKRVYTIHVHDGTNEVLTPGDVVIDGFTFVGGKGDLVAMQSELTYYHDLVLWTKKGKTDRLTRLNPQVDTWKLPQISIFKWVGAEGDTVEGILELPPDYDGKSKLPLLVTLHGGPTASEPYCFLLWIYGRTSFAAKGYAMLAPNYRGSTGYGDKFLTDLIGHENDRDVTDIMTGVDALIEKGIVDPERMGVAGWSNGGFLTNCLISNNRFKAASSGAGVLDMTVQLLEEDTPGHVLNYMEGLPWEQPKEYQDASPLFDLKPGIKTAVLIHVGENDPRVPVSHSKGLHRMLRQYLDVPCELVIYPSAGHNLTKYTHRLAKTKWDHAWFDRYLMGE